MTLAQFLETTETTQTSFADQIGTSQANVTRWARGERLPQRQWILKIDAATQSAVRLEDWYSAAQPRREPIRRQVSA